MLNGRELLKDKQRIVIKIGSSSLTHPETGDLNLLKIERLVRVLSDIRSRGKEVVLVSSGAIAVGVKALGFSEKPTKKSMKQACAAVGQARLMMVYQKLFAEYNQISAQILMTKYTMTHGLSKENAKNTFQELLHLGVIPIVNENDTVSTEEIEFGDNDTLSALVAVLIQADLLILLSDIDGLFTDDPNKNPDATLIHTVEQMDEKHTAMAKGAYGHLGTGGMTTKILAANLACACGTDMVIANGADTDVIEQILDGKEVGTIFLSAEHNRRSGKRL